MEPAKRFSSSTPYSLQRLCSSQLVERTQLRHFLSWLDKSSSRLILRASRTAGVLLRTFMPSLAGSTQAADSARAPVSTTHMRQAPISLMPLR